MYPLILPTIGSFNSLSVQIIIQIFIQRTRINPPILAGELQDAKNHLMRALELRPNLLEPREFLAWIFEKLGNIDEARRKYELLLKLDPLNKKIHERMASVTGFTVPMDVGTAEYRAAAKEAHGATERDMEIKG